MLTQPVGGTMRSQCIGFVGKRKAEHQYQLGAERCDERASVIVHGPRVPPLHADSGAIRWRVLTTREAPPEASGRLGPPRRLPRGSACVMTDGSGAPTSVCPLSPLR